MLPKWLYAPWRDGAGTPLTTAPSVILPSVTVILYTKTGEALCEQRRDNGWWALPGGAIQIGESVHAAATRELYEETGYQIDQATLWLTGIYSDPRYYACSTYVDRTVHYVNMTFFVDFDPGDQPPRCSQESLQVAWRAIDALPTPLMPSHALRLADALDNISARQSYPIIR